MDPPRRPRVRLVGPRDTPDVTRTPGDGTVQRHVLLERLRDAGDACVVLLMAPAGSGKTTLLRQWAADDPRPVAWVDAARLPFGGVATETETETAIAIAIEEALPSRP